MRDPARTVIFACTARTGLGHVRRVSLIAEALRASVRSLHLEILTNALIPERCARVFDTCTVTPRRAMAAAIARRSPDAVIIDTARVLGLDLVDAARVLVLRATKPEKLHKLQLGASGCWDAVIVPNPPDEWTPGPELRCRRCEHVGWIGRPGEVAANGAGRATGTPRIVVTGGGGGGAAGREFAARVTSILTVLRRNHPALDVLWIEGGRGEGTAPPDVTRVSYIDDLPAVLTGSDLAITAAGYNTVLELAPLDVPTLLVPLPRTYDDQAARARTWSARLGRTAIDPDDDSAAAAWATEVLATRARRVPTEVDAHGAERAAGVIAAVLREAPRREETFEKRYDLDPSAGVRAAARAGVLADNGVLTPVATFDAERRTLLMPRVWGVNARIVLRGVQTRAEREACAGELVAPLAALHGVPPAALALSALDPWKRVRPRLEGAPVPLAARGHVLIEKLDPVLANAHWRDAVVVHGDFHAGQVIFTEDGGVLLDLDDLALGRPEGDLGNFIAYLATSLEGSPEHLYEVWTDAILSGYVTQSATCVDRELVAAHAAAALLRRALKLRERGVSEREASEIVRLAEELAGRVVVYQPITSIDYPAGAPRTGGTGTTKRASCG